MQLKGNLQFFAGEKTEKATPKKKQDVRKKGQVAKSQEVNTAIILFSVFLCLSFTGEYLLNTLFDLLRHTFQEFTLLPITEHNLQEIFLISVREFAILVAPILLVTVLAGLFANYAQVGFLFSGEAIKFSLEKINPIKGFKRIFSLRSIVELVKSILKIAFIGCVTLFVIWNQQEQILRLPLMSIGEAFIVLAKLTLQMGYFASGALLFLAILDYFYQKYDFEKNIRMSKQDIKDEFKNTEGDPLIKSKIKQRQKEMAMRRMMQEVPKADVVITNPTHYAIALKYDEKKYDAPYVIAKGIDHVAQKIKFIAKENNVVTVENRPLARALYAQADIGDVIPDEFFKAVAEILAYVYRIKK
ncbi:flagellar biosynthesis protein FlhB [Bacillaceae bacterium Marseille-Q3522]|nr:flagellar biosynthesis protein FlhB [Bacillaceae bacterium Marseille-Q3522]